jgi:hypothetical protein
VDTTADPAPPDASKVGCDSVIENVHAAGEPPAVTSLGAAGDAA